MFSVKINSPKTSDNIHRPTPCTFKIGEDFPVAIHRDKILVQPCVTTVRLKRGAIERTIKEEPFAFHIERRLNYFPVQFLRESSRV
jgi:hypothetical protein